MNIGMEKFLHFVVPRHTNNNRAKLLSPFSLFILMTAILVFQYFLWGILPKAYPDVLGYASNISVTEVIEYTNTKRKDAGLSPLYYNEKLTLAAQAKARHMLDSDYWAHVAPDGTQPWQFIIDNGYKYRYAGENLARDFTNANSAVEAWMASPTHKENLLSPNYRDIGIAVIEGDLNGVDTTIIVQLFGTPYADSVVSPVAETESKEKSIALIDEKAEVSNEATSIQEQRIAISGSPEPITQTYGSTSNEILISPLNVTKTTTVTIISLLLLLFVIDALIVSRKRIVRIGGRTIAHISFLVIVLSLALIIKSGQII